MVPSHNKEGLIPPMDVADPTSHYRSPYPTTWDEVIARFATSLKRVEILLGLVAYRDALRGEGIVDGFQWLTGSFVEQIPREPNDVDVVTFFHAPAGLAAKPVAALQKLFDPRQTKKLYHCDAYPIVLTYPPGEGAPVPVVAVHNVGQTAYWYGLFSHRRGTDAWKGFVQLPLALKADDDAAQAKLLVRQGALQRTSP